MNGLLAVMLFLAILLASEAKVISITTIKEEPYAMGPDSKLEGYCVDLIKELAKLLNFKYNLHVVHDGRYGALDASGNWNGMIGEVIRGEADLAVAPLTVTAVRERYVDMSAPFIQTGLSFIVRQSSESEGSSFSLLAPLSAEMWVGVLVAFLLTGLCLFLVGRLSPSEWAEPDTDVHSFTLLHSFWYITGALTLQGAGPHPKALSGRLISAIWWMFALLLLACYFANFHSALHSQNRHISVSTFEELANQDVLDYGTVESGSTMLFFKNSNNPVFRRIYQHMERKKSYVPSMEEGIRRTQEGDFVFIGEAVSLDLAVARYCKLTRAQEIISMRSYSIAAPLGSPLLKNLSVGVLQLSESGELTHLREKWWSSSCLGGAGPQASGALQARDLQGLFLLLGLGLGAGLLLALLELLSRARSRAKEGKNSCCSVLTAELNRRFTGSGADAERQGLDKSSA